MVNKADGALREAASLAVAEYRHALTLLRPATGDWRTPVLSCSARTGAGIDGVWEAIGRYRDQLGVSGALAARRGEQATAWLWNEIRESLIEAFRAHPEVRATLAGLEDRVRRGELPPTAAAMLLLERVLGPGAVLS